MIDIDEAGYTYMRECKKLTQKEYKRRHDNVARVVQ